MRTKQSRINQIPRVERSPEKAGVGGSIPSLATTFQALTQTLLRALVAIPARRYCLVRPQRMPRAAKEAKKAASKGSKRHSCGSESTYCNNITKAVHLT